MSQFHPSSSCPYTSAFYGYRTIVLPARDTRFLSTYHLPDFLDLRYIQWHIFSDNSPSPETLLIRPATLIQRAYRRHLVRKRDDQMLALAMVMHPRLGAGSHLAGVDGDILYVIKRML